MQRLQEDSNALNRKQDNSNRKNNPKMYTYGRELCFVLAILFTTYAALQNAPPKVSKSPPAVPFFSPNSFIADSFRGELAAPFERFSESEASFVMYYAPWDAECQEMRSAIRTVAQYYYKQVYFAAINCWQPQSECKLQFSNIQQYPVIILYIQHSKGIQYKGIKDANNLIHFIKTALNPLHRINSWDDLFKLLAEYDAIVVGFFDFQNKNSSSAYQLFYNTALKFLEKDPNNEVAFGVVTNLNIAKNLGIYKIPSIQLYLWNESVSYHGEATEDSICLWITQNIHQVTVWISPPGVKSLTLSPYVEDGPVLIMFTPRNPYAINLNYDLLKEVGLDYYNCDNHIWVNKLISYVIKNRQEKKQKFIKDLQMCKTNYYDKSKDKTDEVIPISLPPIESSRWANISYPDICQTCNELCRKHSQQQKGKPGQVFQKGSSECEFLKKESPQINNDLRSPEQLNIITRDDRCREIRKALQISSSAGQNIIREPRPHRDTTSPPTENFKGFACQTNQTLALLALDSLKFTQFAEGLGIDVTKYQDKTSVVIFNAQDETAFILNSPFNKANLQSFIVNYTKGILPRSAPRRSRSSAFLNIYHTLSAYSECNLESEYACVPELDAATFLDALESQKQALVVFFHTDHCAFCHGATAHAFLMLARYFRHASDFIQFARLDGEAHDLPWQFTMDRYPAVVFFPGDNRESESRLFPRDRAFTLPNLISFVMSNLVPEERCLAVISSLCAMWLEPEDASTQVNEKGFSEAGQRCLSSARRAYLHRIADILARYRRLSYLNVFQNSISRREILLTLQHLRECYFLLETGNGDTKLFSHIRQSYKNYVLASRALKAVSNIDNKINNKSQNASGFRI